MSWGFWFPLQLLMLKTICTYFVRYWGSKHSPIWQIWMLIQPPAVCFWPNVSNLVWEFCFAAFYKKAFFSQTKHRKIKRVWMLCHKQINNTLNFLWGLVKPTVNGAQSYSQRCRFKHEEEWGTKERTNRSVQVARSWRRKRRRRTRMKKRRRRRRDRGGGWMRAVRLQCLSLPLKDRRKEGRRMTGWSMAARLWSRFRATTKTVCSSHVCSFKRHLHWNGSKYWTRTKHTPFIWEKKTKNNDLWEILSLFVLN